MTVLGLDRVIDEDWFARLYRDSYRRLVLVAYAMTNDLSAAEEITQRAFTLAFDSRAVLVDADSPEAWVRATVIDLARKPSRRVWAVVDRIRRRHPGEPEPTAPAEDPHAAFQALPEEQRRILMLHHLGELPVDEVAAIVDSPVETVQSQLADARAALATHLGTQVDASGLDTRIAELRQRLRESVPEPELHQALIRSRQRTGRRRTRIGAAIAVVVVAAAIPGLRTTLRPVADDEAAAAATSTTQVPTDIGVWHPTDPFFFIDFADETHGYALRAYCRSSGRCQNALLVTEDGTHWEIRGIPEPVAETEAPAGRLLVLGQREIAIGEWSETSQRARWYSDDAGRTWQEVRVEVEETTESIPPGAVMEHECTDRSEKMPECRKSRLLVTLPGSGRRVALANQPPLERMWPDPIPAGDGNWWATGVYPSTDKWALAVSRNAGRHWTVVPVPDIQGRPPQRMAVSAGPNALYLTAHGELPDSPHGLLAIFRSTDGGKAWEQTWQAAKGREPRVAYAVVPAADGSLRVMSPFGERYVSRNGGRDFVADTDRSTRPSRGYPLGWVMRTKGGYLEQAVTNTNTFRFSTDGLVWKDIVVPVK